MIPVVQKSFMFDHVGVLQTKCVIVKGFHLWIDLCVAILVAQVNLPRVAGDHSS